MAEASGSHVVASLCTNKRLILHDFWWIQELPDGKTMEVLWIVMGWDFFGMLCVCGFLLTNAWANLFVEAFEKKYMC